MTDVDYDVVVLGAGPVGLAVAAALGGEGLACCVAGARRAGRL